MLKPVIHHFKLLLILFIEIVFRFKKICNFIWYRKHELERILEADIDTHDRTRKIDDWLERTRCKPIRVFLNKNFTSNYSSSIAQKAIARTLSDRVKSKAGSFKNLEDEDESLNFALKELLSELYKLIEKNKRFCMWTTKSKERLLDSLYRILSYKMTTEIAEQLAATKYDAKLESHSKRLMSFWNNLVIADKQKSSFYGPSESTLPPELSYEISNKSEIVSNRWSHVGFQGEDPGTDFRGMGILGLIQLEYLSRKPQQLARDLLSRSLNEKHSYPYAIVGINITYSLLNLFKDGSMKHLYYDTRDVSFKSTDQHLKIVKTLNELYVELYLRFDCFWHESKPKTIFEFKELMEKFVSIIQFDLCNRNFCLNFVYS